MQFLKLTLAKSGKIFVNMSHVCEMRQLDNVSRMFYPTRSDGEYEFTDVQESCEEIMEMMVKK